MWPLMLIWKVESIQIKVKQPSIFWVWEAADGGQGAMS